MLASAPLGARPRDHQGMDAWGDIGVQIGEACSAPNTQREMPCGDGKWAERRAKGGAAGPKGLTATSTW